MGKYRGFPVEGDSMPPHKDQSIIIGRYVENLNELKPSKSYMFITRDGMIFKRLEKIEDNLLHVSADNPWHKPYSISAENLLEI